MTGNWYDSTLHARLRMSEMQARAEQERLARQVRGQRPRRLRNRVGTVLIVAGEALVRQSQAVCADCTGAEGDLALAKVRY